MIKLPVKWFQTIIILSNQLCFLCDNTYYCYNYLTTHISYYSVIEDTF